MSVIKWVNDYQNEVRENRFHKRANKYLSFDIDKYLGDTSQYVDLIGSTHPVSVKHSDAGSVRCSEFSCDTACVLSADNVIINYSTYSPSKIILSTRYNESKIEGLTWDLRKHRSHYSGAMVNFPELPMDKTYYIEAELPLGGYNTRQAIWFAYQDFADIYEEFDVMERFNRRNVSVNQIEITSHWGISSKMEDRKMYKRKLFLPRVTGRYLYEVSFEKNIASVKINGMKVFSFWGYSYRRKMKLILSNWVDVDKQGRPHPFKQCESKFIIHRVLQKIKN